MGKPEQRKLRIYINPSWTYASYDELIDLPEGWDLWTEGEQHDYVQEAIEQQIADNGYEVVTPEVDDE